MKLYDFDGIDASLKLIPLAARRALDAIGAKLSLDGFHSMDHAERAALVETGSGQEVNQEATRQAIAGAKPAAAPINPIPEPNSDHPSQELLRALGEGHPLPEKTWQSLSALDRYVLVKVSQKNRRERLHAAYEEIVGASSISTHVKPAGGVHMVSIAGKEVTVRRAKAECWIRTSSEAYQRLVTNAAPKGDVLATARLAGIMATKKTSDLIPLCHPLALQHADIEFEEHEADSKLRVLCTVEVEAHTGVEMEAMVGANVAALTVYDMLKSIDRGMVVGPTRLLEKTGGRSGTFQAKDAP